MTQIERETPSNPILDRYKKETVIGAGVIGTSWTALFLARCLEVTVNDPRPDLAQAVTQVLAQAAPALQALGLPAFIQHLGPGLAALWKVLGDATLDEVTVKLLTDQDEATYARVPYDVLESQRDLKELAVLNAQAGIAETFEAGQSHLSVERAAPSEAPSGAGRNA